ncbi:MAG: HPr family phosphocarrier protein [Chthoniobacteraceae bacterium]
MALNRKAPDQHSARTLTVRNKLGLHARPAAQLVRAVQSFRSDLWIVSGGKRYDAGRLMELLTANLDHGATFEIEAHGPDAEAAVTRVEQLLIEFRDAEERGEMS